MTDPLTIDVIRLDHGQSEKCMKIAPINSSDRLRLREDRRGGML